MDTTNNYKDFLYRDVIQFLHSIFIIDTISFEDHKPLEPLTYERIFNKRCELLKATYLIFDKVAFAEDELCIIKDSIEDLESHVRIPRQLLSEPLYSAAKGYINYLNTLIPSKGTALEYKDGNKYQELREKLTPYISITTEDLKKLIEGQPLQKGAAKWIGDKTEAYRFAYWLNPEGTARHKNFKAFFNNNVDIDSKISDGLAPKRGSDDFVSMVGARTTIWDILKQFRLTKEIDQSNN